jgi:general secretion pathway protein D
VYSTATTPSIDLGVGNFSLESNTLIYQYMSDNVRARMQLLKGQNRVTSLGTPILLSANNHESRIFVGEERPLVRSFQLQTNTNQSIVTERLVPEVEIEDIGNTLRIIPRINADGTITLEVNQDSSTAVIGGASLPIALSNGTVNTVPIDTVNTSNIQATIIGENGMTLAIGGLIREQVSKNTSKIPILGDIPLLGFLFRREVTNKQKRELVLLVTPYIIRTGKEGVALTKKRMDKLSIHPYHEKGDKALSTYKKGDAPVEKDTHLWFDAFLQVD